jgi:transcriptional regulator with XRE-family HTH domain
MDGSSIPNLKRLRTERFLSQAQLGEAIGISRRTLIRWESGQGEPGPLQLRVLATFFGVSIDQLVGDLLPPDAPGALPKVRDLTRGQVNYWIAKVRGLPVEITEAGPVLYEPGFGQRPIPAYCTDWAHGGPIFDRRDIRLEPFPAGSRFDGETMEADVWVARCADHPVAAWGASKLEAAMRAYLVAEVGLQILA